MDREYPNEAIIGFYNNSGVYRYTIEEILQGVERDFSDLLNDLGIVPLPPLQNNDPYRIRIVIHSLISIRTYNAQRREDVNNFAQGLLENKKGGHDVNNWTAIPCIHISEEDSIAKSLYDNKPLHKAVPRSFQILDNSIWNYFVSKYEIPNFDNTGRKITVKYEDSFFEALKSIIRNYEKHLYNLSVAKEYADLNARLAKEAFVAGSHAEGVSPFIFHSESAIQRMIRKEFLGEEDVLNRISNMKWRILLLDDKAIKGMECNIDNSATDYQWNCKLFIIINLLDNFLMKHTTSYGRKSAECRVVCKDQRDGEVKYRRVDNNRQELVEIDKKDINDDIIVMFEYAQSVKDAENALTDKTYDLILLDYYLEKDDEDNHSYGTDLLESIYTNVSVEKRISDLTKQNEEKRIYDYQDVKYEDLRKYINKKGHEDLSGLFQSQSKDLISNVVEKLKTEKKFGKGPGGKKFFMFISAYSSAVHDRLLAEGLNQSEDFWYISLGACPTNTPQLFLYNLIKMMERRLDDSHISELSTKGVVETVSKIFASSSPRQVASDSFQDIQNLQYHYRSMLKNVEVLPNSKNVFETSGSVLMTNFIQNHIQLGALLEHLAQLIHITAFGTIRQWPEMWEEYLYFKSQLEKLLNYNIDIQKGQRGRKTENVGLLEKFEQMCVNIEGYIRKMKSSVI